MRGCLIGSCGVDRYDGFRQGGCEVVFLESVDSKCVSMVLFSQSLK